MRMHPCTDRRERRIIVAKSPFNRRPRLNLTPERFQEEVAAELGIQLKRPARPKAAGAADAKPAPADNQDEAPWDLE
jgi:hypothetical protein